MSYEELAPLKFVDSLEKKRHIALFYKDSEYARLIEFRFLKSGLARGEQCVYATGEDSGYVVLKLLSYGIPLDYFLTKKIQVMQLGPTSGDHDKIMDDCKKNLTRIMTTLESPFRIVARIVPDVTTMTGMKVELELEKKTHDAFEDLGGSIMCPYDLCRIEPTRQAKWLSDLRENHHDVIYAPKFGMGEVFSYC